MKYEEFKSTPVLYEAYKKTRRGKRSKKAEAIFESSETENLKRIARQIDKGYLPAGLDSFMIYEPKARTINAPAFRDKIVQRDLTDNVIYPALVKSIPFNAFAAQTGKGQHYGVDMMEKQMRHYFLKRKAADEQRRRELGLPYRPMEEWDYSDGWVVKGDVRKCFESTDQEKLKAAVCWESTSSSLTRAWRWDIRPAISALCSIYPRCFISSIRISAIRTPGCIWTIGMQSLRQKRRRWRCLPPQE